MDVIKKVEQFCLDRKLFKKGDTLVIGCSGGPDSLALLDILAALQEPYALQLIAVYVHHGLRAEADGEAAFVRQAAASRHCQFEAVYVDVKALGAARQESVETVGRTERYRIFKRLAKTYGATAIAVAHHQNDQAETVLLHLLRGSGLQGLGAMHAKNGIVIRPLLCLTRPDIEEYITAQGLTPCHDLSNDEPVFTRNRIRLEIIPFLQRYNPAIIADLNRLSLVAQGDEAVLQDLTDETYRRHAQPIPGGVALPLDLLQHQRTGLVRRLIRQAVETVTGNTQNVSFHHIETVRALLGKEKGKEFHSRYWQAYRTCDTVCIVRPKRQEPKRQRSGAVAVTGPGQYQLDDYTVTFTLVPGRAYTPGAEQAAWDYDALTFPLTLRYRQAGDTIALSGGTKKMKKYYIEHNIPASLRYDIPLVCQGHHVLWLCGYERSRTAPVTGQTKWCFVGTITRRTMSCIKM